MGERAQSGERVWRQGRKKERWKRDIGLEEEEEMKGKEDFKVREGMCGRQGTGWRKSLERREEEGKGEKRHNVGRGERKR